MKNEVLEVISIELNYMYMQNYFGEKSINVYIDLTLNKDFSINYEIKKDFKELLDLVRNNQDEEIVGTLFYKNKKFNVIYGMTKNCFELDNFLSYFKSLNLNNFIINNLNLNKKATNKI